MGDFSDSPAPSKDKFIGGHQVKREESDSEEPFAALKSETKRAANEQEKKKDQYLFSKDFPTGIAAASLKDDSNKSPNTHSEKDSETTIDTAHTEQETVQESPYEPTNANEPLRTDLDDDFISALKSLQVDDEQFDIINLDQGVLEDLEVDSEEDLLPLEDFSDVFSDRDDIDVVADLQDNLNSLSIAQDQKEMDQEQKEIEDLTENGEIPWYLLCRECEPDQEDPLSIQLSQYQGLSEDEQLQLSLQNMGDANHILDGEEEYSEQEQVYEESFQTYIVSRRREAVAAAISFTRAFGTGLYQPPPENATPPNERVCFGHKETIYCVYFSECGKYLATASQDSSVCIWDAAKNALLSTLTGHSKDHECLRVTWAPSKWSTDGITGTDSCTASFLASGGADGMVKVWLSADPSKRNSWECVSTIDHSSFEGKPKSPPLESGQEDIPQIYALQFIEHWQGLSLKDSFDKNSFLMSSSDDYIHLWEMDVCQDEKENSLQITFSEVFSIRFTAHQGVNNGVTVCNVTSSGLKVSQKEHPSTFGNNIRTADAFGGFRNPNNTIYVFDAQYCPGNGLLGVALSDGTLRLVNGRGVFVSILSLPGCKSHLTSFTWDSTGSRLASCVAQGSLILWNIHHSGADEVNVSCAAVLEGGHVSGRPLFGAQYCGVDDSEDLIVSWGVDGRLCLWDSLSHGQIHAPISTLVSRQDYPIYSVDISSPSDKSSIVSRLAVGGGGADPGFMGMPLYLYDVERMS